MSNFKHKCQKKLCTKAARFSRAVSYSVCVCTRVRACAHACMLVHMHIRGPHLSLLNSPYYCESGFSVNLELTNLAN